MIHERSARFLDFGLIAKLPERFLAWLSPESVYVADLLGLAELRSGTRFLDVGCGTGSLLCEAAYREPGAILAGIDSDHDAVELARARARNAPGRIRVEVARAEAVPFADDSFDVVACTLTLAAMDSPLRRGALAECARVLKPQGRIVVAERAPYACAAARIAGGALVTVGPRWLAGYLHDVDLLHELRAAGYEDAEAVRRYHTLSGPIDLFSARVA